jgi:hypothetical protein
MASLFYAKSSIQRLACQEHIILNSESWAGRGAPHEDLRAHFHLQHSHRLGTCSGRTHSKLLNFKELKVEYGILQLQDKDPVWESGPNPSYQDVLLSGQRAFQVWANQGSLFL